jgi:acyl-CoA thioesterase II
MNLEEATRVEGSDGRYQTRLSNEWEVWGPNGGYLAAIALRAAGMHAEIRRPSSLYCHFLSSPKFESVQLEVQVLKRGRRSESLSVCMLQNDKPVLQALIRTTAEAAGYEHQQMEAPHVPPPEALKSWAELWPDYDGPRYKFWNNLESKPVDQSISRQPAEAVRRDWIRFVPQACFEDAFVDAARSLILLDTYGFPAAYQMYPDNRYIAPNLDTSAWFHHTSRHSDWLLIDHACPVAAKGLMGVSGNVWDGNGKLIATGSAHLCCIASAAGTRTS